MNRKETFIPNKRETRSILFTSLLIMISLFSLNATPVIHQSADQNSVFDYLQNGPEVLDITLKTDLSELINNRRRQEYLSADLQVSGSEINWNIEVKLRGKYRLRVCDFPPLKLKFSSEQLSELGFNANFNKLKLVTHCLEGEVGNENVFKEFLIYQLYNQLTPNSYRVRLVRVNYVDRNNQLDNIIQYGFILEPTEEMAQRIGGSECKCENEAAFQLEAKAENMMSVFQYLIGNEDWRAEMKRNIKLIRLSDGEVLIPVPYDFDFAGFVNASYARPRSDLGLSIITERCFLGQGVSEEVMLKTTEKFKLFQKHFNKIITRFELIDQSERNILITYMDTFYAGLNRLNKTNAKKYKSQNKKAILAHNNRK